jgi:hypothetical protein
MQCFIIVIHFTCLLNNNEEISQHLNDDNHSSSSLSSSLVRFPEMIMIQRLCKRTDDLMMMMNENTGSGSTKPILKLSKSDLYELAQDLCILQRLRIAGGYGGSTAVQGRRHKKIIGGGDGGELEDDVNNQTSCCCRCCGDELATISYEIIQMTSSYSSTEIIDADASQSTFIKARNAEGKEEEWTAVT